MRDEEKEKISAAEVEEELNVFDELLALKGKLLVARVITPYVRRQLMIYYMPLTEGEHEAPEAPEDFLKMGVADQAEYLGHVGEVKVWAMIVKANDSGKVPKKYQFSRKQFDELKREFPDVFNEIVGAISGRMAKTLDFFIGGPLVAE